MNIIKCNICERKFDHYRKLGSHTTQTHKISKDDYYVKYINPTIGKCKLCNKPTRFISLSKGYARCCSIRCGKLLDCQNPEYRKKISDNTKIAMQRDDVKQKHLNAVCKPKSEETLNKMSNKAKLRCTDKWKKNLFTKERNKKISDSKFKFWKDNPEGKKQVGNIWKLWKERDEVGWRKHLMEASKKGFEKIYSPNGDTSLEIKLYSMLENEKIQYSKKYMLDGKIYDAYLPNHNVLIEIDGKFWHPESLDNCKYKFQTESFYNDKLKNEIAHKNGIRLVRIKEHEIPNTIEEII